MYQIAYKHAADIGLPPLRPWRMRAYGTAQPQWQRSVELFRGFGFGGLGTDTTAILATAGSRAGTAAIQGVASGNIGQQLVMSAPAIIAGAATPFIMGALSTGAATAGATAGAGASAGAFTGATAGVEGGAAGASAAMSSLVIPLIGVAVAAVTIWLSSYFKNAAQKTAASKVVDAMEPKMQENLRAYLAGPRTMSSREQALNNFDAGWSAVANSCNQIGGGPGERCLTDRQAGACHYQSNGACWNWFVGYRDPIDKDPDVVPDPTTDALGNVVTYSRDASGQVVASNTGTSLDTMLNTAVGGGGMLWLLGGAALLLLALGMGGRS